MDKTRLGKATIDFAESDREIDALAERLRSSWSHDASGSRGAGGTILQRLAHGRLHVVTVASKRPKRRPDGSR
jgi:hypothetical protein